MSIQRTCSQHNAMSAKIQSFAHLWVSCVAWLALAEVRPGQVGANRVLPAGSRLAALVHIDTAGRHVGRVVGPAVLAHAEGLGTLRLAESVLAAGDPAAGLGAAGHAGRTPDKGRQAAAGVAPSRVPTHRVGTTDPGRQQTLIRVQTKCARRGKPSPEQIFGFT